ISGARTWKPASASALIWWRQEYQLSGKPWHSNTRGPWPCSTTFRLMPLVLTIRSIGLRMVLVPTRRDRQLAFRAYSSRLHGRNRGGGQVTEYVRQQILATVASLRIKRIWVHCACRGRRESGRRKNLNRVRIGKSQLDSNNFRFASREQTLA